VIGRGVYGALTTHTRSIYQKKKRKLSKRERISPQALGSSSCQVGKKKRKQRYTHPGRGEEKPAQHAVYDFVPHDSRTKRRYRREGGAG